MADDFELLDAWGKGDSAAARDLIWADFEAWAKALPKLDDDADACA